MAYQPKSYKKFVATAATATLVASAIAPVASAASFTDVADRYKEAVDYIVEKGYAQGYPGGTKFGTNDNIKRQDAAVMVAKALGATAEGNYPAAGFTDVPADRQWAVNFLKDKKIIDGKEAGKFGANDFMTRGEMAKVIANAYELVGNPDNEFPFTDVSATFKEFVDALVENGVTQGKTATQFATGQNVTRGEFALFVFRAENPAAPATPEVVSASALNLKEVEVVFNQNVDVTSAENEANYSFASGSGLSVTDAKANGKTVTLTINNTGSSASQQQTADLTVNGVKAENGEVIAKTTKTVKFLDTVAPTVQNIEVAGPRTLKVQFSEPLKEAPTFSVNEGTLAIVSTNFVAGADTVTLTLGTAPSEGTHSLTVKNGADYAGFKVEEVTRDFAYAKDVTAPVAVVKSASPTKVVLAFDEDINNVTSANVQFYHTYKGVDAYKATKSLNGRELTLEFANPLPEGPFRIFLDYTDDKGTKIADLWGNVLEETTFTGSVVVDTVAPTVTKVEADGNTGIKVTYSEDVTGADNLSNYTLKDAAGKTVNLSGNIAVNATTNTYTIPTPALNGGSYTLTIKNIKDTSIGQNKMADYTTTVAVKDVVAPEVADLNKDVAGTQAQLLSSKKVKISFSEVMDAASITDKANYLFGTGALDSKVTLSAADGNKSVILDFTNVESGAQTTPAGSTINVLRVKDAAGNYITQPSTAVSVPASASAPLFDEAVATGKNTIKLYFDELITAVQSGDFTASVGGTAATVTSVSNEVVDGKSVITLTVDEDIDTAVTNVTVSTTATPSGKNAYGTAIDLDAVEVFDGYAPLLSTAVASSEDNDQFVDTFTLTFSEALYVPSVSDSDFTIEGYEITEVAASGSTVIVSVKEKDVNDLGATPKVTLVGQVEDLDRNVRNTQEAVTATAAQGAYQTAVNAEAAKVASTFNATGAAGDVVKPTVAAGYTIAVKSTSDATVYGLDGKILKDGTSTVVYTVTHTGSGAKADTGNVAVTVDVTP